MRTQRRLKTEVVADSIRHHYQLVTIGWHRARFVINPLLHFDLKENQVWIQQNDTGLEIGDELVRRGVDPQDIVFGFIPEHERDLLCVAA
jgi:hypothetical protein